MEEGWQINKPMKSGIKETTSTFSVSYYFQRNRKIQGTGKGILQSCFPRDHSDISQRRNGKHKFLSFHNIRPLWHCQQTSLNKHGFPATQSCRLLENQRPPPALAR